MPSATRPPIHQPAALAGPPLALSSLDRRQTHRAGPGVIRPRLNHRGGAGHPGTGGSHAISPEELWGAWVIAGAREAIGSDGPGGRARLLLRAAQQGHWCSKGKEGLSDTGTRLCPVPRPGAALKALRAKKSAGRGATGVLPPSLSLYPSPSCPRHTGTCTLPHARVHTQHTCTHAPFHTHAHIQHPHTHTPTVCACSAATCRNTSAHTCTPPHSCALTRLSFPLPPPPAVWGSCSHPQAPSGPPDI